MDYRQRITAACKEMALERGFSGVTVDDLSARVGISKRTIYRYFESKEEIIGSVVDDFMSTVRDGVQKALNSSDNPVEKIMNLLMTVTQNVRLIRSPVLHDLQKYYPHLWEKIEQFRAERVQQVFYQLLSGNEQGCFRAVDPKIVTTALLAGIRAVVNPNFIIENNLTMEETIHSLFRIFLYGIVVERGER